MSEASSKFERQIQRIHELIEESNAQVEWNDHIPDPDNLAQPRQIDVTIKRDGKLTLVECRIHKSKQDVNWIEEIIGRRASLRANAVIAVSASGFTKGAIQKADKFGIILRDILSLSEDEIRRWGKKTQIWLTFYEYTKIQIVFIFTNLIQSRIDLNAILAYLKNNPDKFYGMFEVISNTLDEKSIKGKKATITASLTPKEIEINGFVPKSIEFTASIRSREKQLNIPSVVVYDSPLVDALERNVFIEAVDLGEFEITQSSNNVAMTVDLTPVEIPPNCQFRFVNFDFQRPVTMNGIRILGLPKLEIPVEKMQLGLQFV
jgi:hypothetical protein